MRFKIFQILILFYIISFNAQEKPLSCPRNFDGQDFLELKGKVGRSDGKIIAFDATITEIQTGYNELPYFLLRFENKQNIWVSSMVSAKQLVVGKKIRVLGFLSQVLKDDEIGMKYNKSGVQVRAFAILDTETKQIQMAKVFEKEVRIWKEGKIPNSLEEY